MEGVARTLRQQIVELLAEGERSFEDLRAALGLTVRTLEDHLQHVERSLRRSGRKLVVTPARCLDCGFEFRGRAPRHFHTPSRCPACRSEAIGPASLKVE